MTASRLAVAALLACSLGARAAHQREGTEWSNMWWNNATSTDLPRVLLIGDSITNGYQANVTAQLRGVAYTGFWASSKCLSDPTYLKALDFVVGEYKYDVIHFNNGLHSLNADRAAWLEGLRAALSLLRERGQGAKIIWATSTPLKDPALTAKAKELNELAAPVVKEFGLVVDDLFALMDPQDRDKLWSDTFHYHEPGKQMQGKQVADLIRGLLPARPVAATPPAGEGGPIANAGFEADDKWQVYPNKPEAGTIEFVTDGAKEGLRCAKVTAKQPGLQFHQYAPALVPGATYELSFWARADQAAKLKVHVRTQKPPYAFYGDKDVALTTEWQQFTTTLVIPAEYKSGEHVLFFNLGAVGTYWFDGLSVAKK